MRRFLAAWSLLMTQNLALMFAVAAGLTRRQHLAAGHDASVAPLLASLSILFAATVCLAWLLWRRLERAT
jgi:hypothetical protein